mmetsp:Transcript_78528/g.226980  ORF Transcript_78528/g.226980 Transcript_78528/m.226980 type:complete len:98 (+) Transcript_78528:128-421(+)
MDVTHHIMTELCLLLFCKIKINIIDFCSHFFQLLISDLKSKFLFGSGQSCPKLAPGGKLHGGRPNKGHFLGGITLNQWMLIDPVVWKSIVRKISRGF